MSQEQAGGLVLEFGIADRLRKAREHIGADRQEFAALTGISRGTISNYESPKWRTRKSYVLGQWSLATGVSLKWLETGAGRPTDGPGLSDAADEAALLASAAQAKAQHGPNSASGRYPKAA